MSRKMYRKPFRQITVTLFAKSLSRSCQGQDNFHSAATQEFESSTCCVLLLQTGGKTLAASLCNWISSCFLHSRLYLLK